MMYGSPYSFGGGAAYAGGLGTYRGGYAPAMPYGGIGRTAPVFRTRSSVPTQPLSLPGPSFVPMPLAPAYPGTVMPAPAVVAPGRVVRAAPSAQSLQACTKDDGKFFLAESQVPTHWYNIQADLPEPCPPALHPGTHQPVGPADFAPLFPMELIMQEVSQDRYVEIPEEVREVYKLWRPSPLFRAKNLEKALGLDGVKIFYKYEGVSPAGSHKPNTAVPQAFYNMKDGTKKIVTETGAGQWGSALAFAGAQFGVEIEVYQVKASYKQKPYRRAFMETFGAKCFPSPSERTQAGKKLLAADPNCPGSLGIAISEAVEVAVGAEENKYALGSVLNHVLMHQTVTGQEAIKQMQLAGEYPDVLVGCTGGGSNFAGLCFPFLGQKFRKEAKKNFKVVAAEPASCPSLTRGKYAYDFGDTMQMTPLMKTHTLGHTFMPPESHSGGLRYHGMAPLISHLKELGHLEAVAIEQKEAFDMGALFAKTEGILPAPEANHAIAAAIQEAQKARPGQTVLFNLCGHGNFDMTAWTDYNEGRLVDHAFPEDAIAKAWLDIPAVNEASN
jgi:tryptophan synthase beta chain